MRANGGPRFLSGGVVRTGLRAGHSTRGGGLSRGFGIGEPRVHAKQPVEGAAAALLQSARRVACSKKQQNDSYPALKHSHSFFKNCRETTEGSRHHIGCFAD